MPWNCQHATQTLRAKPFAPLWHLRLPMLVTAWLIHHQSLVISNYAQMPSHWVPHGPTLRYMVSTSALRGSESQLTHALHLQHSAPSWKPGPYRSENASVSLNAIASQHSAVSWRDCPCKAPKRHMIDSGTHNTLMLRNAASSQWICMPWIKKCGLAPSAAMRFRPIMLPQVPSFAPLPVNGQCPQNPQSYSMHHKPCLISVLPRCDRTRTTLSCSSDSTGLPSCFSAASQSHGLLCKSAVCTQGESLQPQVLWPQGDSALTCPLSLHFARAASTMPETPQQEGEKQPRSGYRADGRHRRTAGELRTRAPYVQFWKDVQARQRQRDAHAEDEAPRRHHAQHYRIHTDDGQESQHDEMNGQPSSSGGPSRAGRASRGSRETRDGPWREWSHNEEDWWHWPEEWDADVGVAGDQGSWRNTRRRPATSGSDTHEDAPLEPSAAHQQRKPRKSPSPQVSKRSRSTQVSDEFVKRQTEAAPSQAAPPEEPCADQMARLSKVVDLLEQLAHAGLPTLINAFYRSGDVTKHHDTFHGDPSTASFPRVGNWNLALTGSLLCPPLRAIYKDVSNFGSFMEAFTVCNAKKQPRPPWYQHYQLLVTLIAAMTDTCTPDTYDALKVNSNPAEFIHVFRTHERTTPAKGEAGTGLSHLLHADPTEDAPLSVLPLQTVGTQEASTIDHETESSSDDVKVVALREPAPCTEAPRPSQAPTDHKLIGGHQVRQPPQPPSRSTTEETGTKHWMRANGTPARVRGERAKEISKALTQILRHAAPRIGLHIQDDGYVAMGDLLQAPRIWNQWITEAEIVDVIHYNQKNRFEISHCDGAYLVRARQGHSIDHIQNELILTRLTVDDTPEFVAHGTYYDFYESIVRYGLMAGGRQGQSFRRHVHLVEQLPGSDVVSGMRSDCDLVLWISAQSAAVSGITFYRSANDVILTEATIDPAFFHSVQIMRSLEVLTADGGPPHPQQVALAISRASSRDAQRHGQYMRVVCAHAIVPHRLTSLHASNTHAPVPLPRRTGGLPLGSRGPSVQDTLERLPHAQ